MSASRSVRSPPKTTYSDTRWIRFAATSSRGRYPVVSETTATPTAAQPTARRRELLLATIDKDKVEARLRERADEIAERRRQIKAADEGMQSGELADYDQHPADQGTETFEQELDETTLMILEEEARQVAIAQQRLAEGKYGICVDCGEEIPAARLEAVPEAVRCIKDQNIYEAHLRRPRRAPPPPPPGRAPRPPPPPPPG